MSCRHRQRAGRPAHAQRALVGLHDADRRAARLGARGRPRRARGHRSQHDRGRRRGARARAIERGLPLHVVVGSEIKTAERRRDHRAVPARGDPARPRRSPRRSSASSAQGGLVYMPHPFDRFHTTPARMLLRGARGRRSTSSRPPTAGSGSSATTARPSTSRRSTGCAAAPARTRTCPPASARPRCGSRRSRIPRRSSPPSTTPRSCARPAACCDCSSRSAAASARR